MQVVFGSSKVYCNIHNLSGRPNRFCEKPQSENEMSSVINLHTMRGREMRGFWGEEQERSGIAMNELDIHPYCVL